VLLACKHIQDYIHKTLFISRLIIIQILLSDSKLLKNPKSAIEKLFNPSTVWFLTKIAKYWSLLSIEYTVLQRKEHCDMS